MERQTSFRLRQFFAETLKKWIIIFLPRYFSLTKNSVAIGERCEWKSSIRPDNKLHILTQQKYCLSTTRLLIANNRLASLLPIGSEYV